MLMFGAKPGPKKPTFPRALGGGAVKCFGSKVLETGEMLNMLNVLGVWGNIGSQKVTNI